MSNFNQEQEGLELGSIGDLAEQMVYRLNSCSDLMISKMLQQAFSDFAKNTCCFTTIQEVELERKEREYPIAATIPGMLIDAISEVKYGRKVLENPRHYTTDMIGGVPRITFTFDIADPDFCHEPDPERPVPEREIRSMAERRRRDFEKCKVFVRCVEVPRIGSEKAPRWFLNKYGDAVVSLALFRLFGMSGKPWSDPLQANAELVRYENAATQARCNSFSNDGSQCGPCSVNPVDTSGLL